MMLSSRGKNVNVVLQRITSAAAAAATTTTTAAAASARRKCLSSSSSSIIFHLQQPATSRTSTTLTSRSIFCSTLSQSLPISPSTSPAAIVRHWSSTLPNLDEKKAGSAKDEVRVGGEQQKEERKAESLEETVKRMQQNDGGESGSGFDNRQVEGFMRRTMQAWATFQDQVGETWQELLRSGERKDINKKIRIHHPEDTAEGDTPYTGPVAIMVIDESENLTAWERMQKRLTDAPIIQDILARTDEVFEKTGAKKVKQKVDHLAEDAREAWETSQNPWVYRISSVYETLTAETPESIAVAELRKLDPTFTLDDWRQDVVEHTLPKIMEWLLLGKINQLKPWLGEGVFSRIAAEITARKQEGVQIDTHVLGIMNSEILAVEPDLVNKGSPIIVLHFMCQQINCVRKKKDGTIVEGSEDDIRANSYVAAFQREYDEEAGELNWKIVDFRFNGAIAYL